MHLRPQKKVGTSFPLRGLSFFLSVLLHVLFFIWLFPQLQNSPSGASVHPSEGKERHIRLVKQKAAREQEKKEALRPFVKTSPESEIVKVENADYQGKRDTQISGDEKNKGQVSDAEAPSLKGVERDELNTVEQARQDGALEFDGKKKTQQQAPVQAQEIAVAAHPSPPAPLVSDAPPVKPPTERLEQVKAKVQDAQQEIQQARPHTTHIKELLEEIKEAQSLKHQASVEDKQKAEQGDLGQNEPQPHKKVDSLENMQLQVEDMSASVAAAAVPPVPTSPPAPLYDPMFSPSAQPGFRTAERRSRSTGRFILGRNASLNVEATPAGRYQEEIYRRIAYYWYPMVEDRRGDIIPGSLTIRLLIDYQGRITSMSLVNRTGASISQQSITFAAIRRASIPPMPTQVQKGIVGDKLDLLFTFFFD